MITRTYYVPANKLGRTVLAYIANRITCEMGYIRKVNTELAVPITLPRREIIHLERILQMYNLM